PPVNLFDFGSAATAAHGDPGLNILPWWTAPDWKVRFFRPVSSLSHALDYALWGRHAAMHHATSLALYAMLLWLLDALYRAAGLSRSVALCALAVFVLEDGSVLPVGWIANRNTLIEALFAVSAVLVLLRGLPSPSWLRIAGSLGLGLVSCLAKESGV